MKKLLIITLLTFGLASAGFAKSNTTKDGRYKCDKQEKMHKKRGNQHKKEFNKIVKLMQSDKVSQEAKKEIQAEYRSFHEKNQEYLLAVEKKRYKAHEKRDEEREDRSEDRYEMKVKKINQVGKLHQSIDLSSSSDTGKILDLFKSHKEEMKKERKERKAEKRKEKKDKKAQHTEFRKVMKENRKEFRTKIKDIIKKYNIKE